MGKHHKNTPKRRKPQMKLVEKIALLTGLIELLAAIIHLIK